MNEPALRPSWPWVAAVLVLWALAGCSTTRVIDSEVRAFANTESAASLAAGARYRFERLPSQQNAAGQATLEQMAQVALAVVGLNPQESDGPALRVQLELRAQTLQRSPFDDPWQPGGAPGADLGAWPGVTMWSPATGRSCRCGRRAFPHRLGTSANWCWSSVTRKASACSMKPAPGTMALGEMTNASCRPCSRLRFQAFRRAAVSFGKWT